MYLQDISINEYCALGVEDLYLYDEFLYLLNPKSEYYGKSIDLFSDKFTFSSSLELKKIANSSIQLNEQIDILENCYGVKKKFSYNKSIVSFVQAYKGLFEYLKKIIDIEEKLLPSQLEKKYSGYSEERLQKFDWLNIADAIASKYNVLPFDILKYPWYDVIVLYRYLDTQAYVSDCFRQKFLNKKD